jgi:hypothetical protein
MNALLVALGLLSFSISIIILKIKQKISNSDSATNNIIIILLLFGLFIIIGIKYLIVLLSIIIFIRLIIIIEKREAKKINSNTQMYRVIRYMINNMFVGIDNITIMKNLYKSIEPGQLRLALKDIGELFVNNVDFKEIEVKLKKVILNEDLNNFIHIVKNMDKLGVDQNILMYQEELYMNKYLYYLGSRINNYKMKFLGLGLISVLILIFGLSYPIILNLKELTIW